MRTAKPQRVRCQIHVTQAQVPGNLTERGLIAFARRHHAARLRESSEEELNSRVWRANAVFAFNQPPGDLEFHALFYDVTDGGRNFIREMSVFVSDRTQRTVLHRIQLPRPMFQPTKNERGEMVNLLIVQLSAPEILDLVKEEYITGSGEVLDLENTEIEIDDNS